jgi:hypothetical protein
MEEQLLLFGLEETVGVETECVEAFLCEAFAGRKIGRMGRKRREREEGVDGDTTNIAKVFRERGGDGSNFVGHLFVREREGGGVGRGKRRQEARRRGSVARALYDVDGRVRLVGSGGKAVDGTVGFGDDGENFDAGKASFARACGDVDPASEVSRVAHRYLHVSVGEVFYQARDGASEGSAEE